MLADPLCWSALAADGEAAQAVITVSTVLYVEWGRLGEIGDLYVLPEHRRNGLARRLVEHAKAWCRAQGCSAVSVTITPKRDLPHWYLENGWIRRKYRTNSWKGTLMVINTVGHLAEAAWHHPDITASYAWVEVRLQNHAARAGERPHRLSHFYARLGFAQSDRMSALTTLDA